MIDVKNLVKSYPVENGTLNAVDNVSFHVNRGEIYGIIGLSGAGKSTLIRCINRLEEPSSGTITIGGVDVTALNKKDLLEERKDIGMIFQQFNLFHQKTVRQNIAFPLELAGKSSDEIQKRTDELLEFIGLSDRAKAYPAELSGGMKQRVAIARALATRPKILLSDEGTSALDPANTDSVLNLLRKVRNDLGTTIIMITHQMEVAKSICDRIAVMEGGKIIEENDVRTLFMNPKHPTTKSFISKISSEEETEIAKDFRVEGDLLKLTYEAQVAREPIITDVASHFDVSISILAGRINTLSATSVGYMIVEMAGPDENRRKAIQALKSRGVNVEVVS